MSIYVIGSINMDLVIQAPFMPENGMTITGHDFLENPGGKGANQAVACAKLGGDVSMVGAVGTSFGKQLKDALNMYGVDTTNVKTFEECSSGLAVIIVVDNDNRIILDRGANALVSCDCIDKALENAKEGDYLVCQLEIPQEIVDYAFKLGHKKKMITVLNPAPADKLIPSILEHTDFFIPNQSECEFYTGIYPKDEETAVGASKKLSLLGVKNVVITLGTNGSCCVCGDKFYYTPARLVKAVDTTAAGDTYIGAFVTKLSENASIIEAMEFASIASSITVTRRGAQQSIPYRNEIKL